MRLVHYDILLRRLGAEALNGYIDFLDVPSRNAHPLSPPSKSVCLPISLSSGRLVFEMGVVRSMRESYMRGVTRSRRREARPHATPAVTNTGKAVHPSDARGLPVYTSSWWLDAKQVVRGPALIARLNEFQRFYTALRSSLNSTSCTVRRSKSTFPPLVSPFLLSPHLRLRDMVQCNSTQMFSLVSIEVTSTYVTVL